MKVQPQPNLVTAKLTLRALNDDDASFIVALCNDPAFIEHIGDKQVRDQQSACAYLHNGPLKSYEQHGFGLLCMTLTDTGEAIGMCGILKRDELPWPDIGYALLPQYRSKGFVNEACEAVLSDAARRLKLPCVMAIVSPANPASIRILDKLGFNFLEQRPLSVGQSLVYKKRLSSTLPD